MANTYTRAFENSSVILANLQAKDIDGMNEDQRAKHTEELKAAQDPIGNFGRLLSTYNLKGGALAGLTYGAFVFGLGPVGLALAGAASFMFSKFAATHYAAYKQVAESNQFSQLEGSYFEKAKTASKNVGQFLANSSYRSAVRSMDESAIAKINEDASFYQLGTTTPDNSGFDSKSLGVDLIAGLASVLALAYVPITSPLALLAMATLPVLTGNKASGYVSYYLKEVTPVVKDTVKDSSNIPTVSEDLTGGGAAGGGLVQETQLRASSVKSVGSSSLGSNDDVTGSGSHTDGAAAGDPVPQVLDQQGVKEDAQEYAHEPVPIHLSQGPEGTTALPDDGGARRRSLSAGGSSDTE